MLPNIALTGLLRTALLRRFGAHAAAGATVYQGVHLRDGFHLTLGRDAQIGPQCLLQCRAMVELGDHAVLSTRCLVLTATHQLGSPWERMGATVALPVRVGDGTWVCTGATLLPGVTVGRGVVADAPAVVVKTLDTSDSDTSPGLSLL